MQNPAATRLCFSVFRPSFGLVARQRPTHAHPNTLRCAYRQCHPHSSRTRTRWARRDASICACMSTLRPDQLSFVLCCHLNVIFTLDHPVPLVASNPYPFCIAIPPRVIHLRRATYGSQRRL
ncbi:hypothetical protein B0H13DRAFT_2354141 [Mycena leptocephala]|nr:hypothetical protein B0H13DRAFT_2354141 [Mycena leptocephala]